MIHENFLAAIHARKLLEVVFSSTTEGIKTRICVPFDFGPWRRNIQPNPDRYHFYDLNSPDGRHNLSLLPEQLVGVKILEEEFDPSEIVTWQPNWHVQRDWGIHS